MDKLNTAPKVLTPHSYVRVRCPGGRYRTFENTHEMFALWDSARGVFRDDEDISTEPKTPIFHLETDTSPHARASARAVSRTAA